jgi:hypothetical protein
MAWVFLPFLWKQPIPIHPHQNELKNVQNRPEMMEIFPKRVDNLFCLYLHQFSSVLHDLGLVVQLIGSRFIIHARIHGYMYQQPAGVTPTLDIPWLH